IVAGSVHSPRFGLAPVVFLDLVIGRSRRGSRYFQPLPANRRSRDQFIWSSIEDDRAMSHDEAPRAELESDRHFLLDEDRGDALPGNVANDFRQMLDDLGSKTLGRFID